MIALPFLVSLAAAVLADQQEASVVYVMALDPTSFRPVELAIPVGPTVRRGKPLHGFSSRAPCCPLLPVIVGEDPLSFLQETPKIYFWAPPERTSSPSLYLILFHPPFSALHAHPTLKAAMTSLPYPHRPRVMTYAEIEEEWMDHGEDDFDTYQENHFVPTSLESPFEEQPFYIQYNSSSDVFYLLAMRLAYLILHYLPRHPLPADPFDPRVQAVATLFSDIHRKEGAALKSFALQVLRTLPPSVQVAFDHLQDGT